MLNKQMIHLISTYTIGCVATARADGAPAVSPKATFLIFDDHTIAFANIRSPGTINNLSRDPRVEINLIDVFERMGCRVRGEARYISRDEAPADLQEKFRNEWPDLYDLMQGFVLVDVTEAETLSSPSYDVGAVPDQLVEHWLAHYANELGFDIVRKADISPPYGGT